MNLNINRLQITHPHFEYWKSVISRIITRTCLVKKAFLIRVGCMSPWSSKSLFSRIEEKAMPPLVFYHFICAFLCHCRSFKPFLCLLSALQLSYVRLAKGEGHLHSVSCITPIIFKLSHIMEKLK